MIRNDDQLNDKENYWQSDNEKELSHDWWIECVYTTRSWLTVTNSIIIYTYNNQRSTHNIRTLARNLRPLSLVDLEEKAKSKSKR